VARVARIVVLAMVVATALAVLTGCAEKGPTYVDAGAVHTKATVIAILEQTDTSAIADRPAADGAKLRHQALAALRRQGTDASSVADVLTRTFPSDTRGVPVYVERASYDGKDAILVVEATGPDSGKLNAKGLWVISESGDVLFAGGR